MFEAFIIALIAAFGTFDYQLGTTYIFRPITLGPLVGLVLGDLHQGTVIGANLELFFMGAVSVGAYIPPDVIVGGVLATSFAIVMGQGTETAIALALPIALLSLAVGNFTDAITPVFLKVADLSAENGSIKGVRNIHMLYGFINCCRRFILVFMAYWLGVNQMEVILDAIPPVLINGMAAAAGLLPALGFAMLMRMILNKQLVPFYFLGFLLSAYFNMPILGVAILGIILVIEKFGFLQTGSRKLQPETGSYEEDDDDF